MEAKKRERRLRQIEFAKLQQKKFNHLHKVEDKFDVIQRDLDSLLHPHSFVPDLKHMVALILRILIECNFRIGTPRYVEQYHTYGITTLLCQHAELGEPWMVSFDFVGKKQVRNRCEINDPTLYRYISWRQSHAHPKDVLFVYRDAKNNWIPISSAHVNEFLHRYGAITTRQLRTLRANQLFRQHFQDEINHQNEMGIHFRPSDLMKEVVKEVASDLHHTSATCKRYYIDPTLLGSLQSLSRINQIF
jgi:DNA topoisomerase-1